MQLPNWLKRKASAMTRAMTLILPLAPGAGLKPRYESLSREGYGQNSVVYACVNEISGAAACVPWRLYRNTNKGRVEEKDPHPLLKLIQRPNPFMGRFEFMETVMAHLYLSGNTYIEAVGPDRSPPRELYPLRPDRMTVLPDRTHLIAGYEYRVSGQTVRLNRDRVAHLKLFHPLDDWYGLSPVQVAALAVDKINACDRWNSALLQNSAVPSGALVSRKRLSEEQFDRLKSEMQNELQGIRNARLPLLLEEDLDWKELGLSPKDMDWIEGLKISALQIAQIFNMPPELIGLQPATHQNRKEARKALYTEVVLPALSRLCDALNRWLTPHFGNDLVLTFDVNGIDALAEERHALWQRVNQSRCLTINEKRELLGYDALSDGDVLQTDPPNLPR